MAAIKKGARLSGSRANRAVEAARGVEGGLICERSTYDILVGSIVGDREA